MARLLPYLLPFFSLGLSTPLPGAPHPNAPLPLPARIVAQLSSVPTWLENVAVRSNGDLVITQLAPTPVLYTVKSPSSKQATIDPIYTFNAPNAAILLGIAETLPDVFAIVAGNATQNSTGYLGSFSVWEASFASPSSSTPRVRKITDIPEAKLLNGVVSVPENPHIVLIADSQTGLLFRLDTKSGKYSVAADRPEFKPAASTPAAPGFGINGVRIRDGYLYFSNSNALTISRLRITSTGHVAQKGAAPVELYANLSPATSFVDDFTFAADGTIFATSNLGNSLVAVRPGGRDVKQVLGGKGELTVAGDTAAAFGRTKADRETLYVVTAGALAAPVNGTVVEPGKVVAVDTKGWCW